MDKTTFSLETDRDKDIETLAEAKANCYCYKQYNMCQVPCEQCTTQSKIQACYKALAVCDQLRVDNLYAKLVVMKLAVYKNKSVHRRQAGMKAFRTTVHILITLLMISIFLPVIFLVRGMVPHDTQPRFIDNDYFIATTFDRMPDTIYDLNNDGLVNCIDWSLQFKKTWNEMFESVNCELVRNNNIKTGMNHLFVRVRQDTMSEWIYIEPQGNKHNYLMTSYWGSMYDPKYNNYGETVYWLSKLSNFWR